MQTQSNAILNHLQNGNHITQIDALNLFQCFRLASRIHDLKQAGHKICSNKVTLNNGKVVSNYFLAV